MLESVCLRDVDYTPLFDLKSKLRPAYNGMRRQKELLNVFSCTMSQHELAVMAVLVTGSKGRAHAESAKDLGLPPELGLTWDRERSWPGSPH